MPNRKSLGKSLGAMLFVLAIVPGVIAQGNESKATYLRFSQPVRLPGVTLGSGTYVFEVLNPHNGSDVVHVMSADRRIAYFLGYTRSVERHRPFGPEGQVSFGESTPDTARSITAWWPTGESVGHAFIYR
jgi:hypothetical protein